MKMYTDSEIRGERSKHPDDVEQGKKQRELFFTENAKKKYEVLTGSQRTFIDRELDDLKSKENREDSHQDNADLEQKIVFEKDGTNILVTDILYDAYRKSDEYQEAQTRMDEMNN